MSQGVRLMAFWAKQAQNGETYHEGKLGGATVRLFLNGYKKTDRDPDVIMYLSQTPFDKNKGKTTQAPQQRGNVVTPRPQQAAPPKPAYKDHTQGGYGVGPHEEIPFPEDPDGLPF